MGSHQSKTNFVIIKKSTARASQRQSRGAAFLMTYITLISNDAFEFIITTEAAQVSGTLRNMLQSTFKETSERRIRLHEFDGRVLGKVVEYLYYNLKYKDSMDVPEFDIPEEMALELLDASDFLDV